MRGVNAIHSTYVRFRNDRYGPRDALGSAYGSFFRHFSHAGTGILLVALILGVNAAM